MTPTAILLRVAPKLAKVDILSSFSAASITGSAGVMIGEAAIVSSVVTSSAASFATDSASLSDIVSSSETVYNMCLLDEVENFIVIYCACSLTQRLESSFFDQ
ncbi:hypothetical protein AKJ16_DCAP21141, partial [Drosera capensis]